MDEFMLNMDVYTASVYLENQYKYSTDPNVRPEDYLRINTITDLKLDRYDTESTTALIELGNEAYENNREAIENMIHTIMDERFGEDIM